MALSAAICDAEVVAGVVVPMVGRMCSKVVDDLKVISRRAMSAAEKGGKTRTRTSSTSFKTMCLDVECCHR